MAKNKKMIKRQTVLFVVLSVLIDVLFIALLMTMNVDAAEGVCPNCLGRATLTGYERLTTKMHREVWNCDNCGTIYVEEEHTSAYVTVTPHNSNQHLVSYSCYCDMAPASYYADHAFTSTYEKIDDFTHKVIKTCICGEIQTHTENHDIGIENGTCACGHEYTVGQLDARYVCGMCDAGSTRHYTYIVMDDYHIDIRVCDYCDYFSQIAVDHSIDKVSYVSDDDNTHTRAGNCVCSKFMIFHEPHIMKNLECSLCEYKAPTAAVSYIYELSGGNEPLSILLNGDDKDCIDISDSYFLTDDCVLNAHGFCAMNGGVAYYKWQVLTVDGKSDTIISEYESSGELSEYEYAMIVEKNIANYEKKITFKCSIDLATYRGKEFIVALYAVGNTGQSLPIATFRGIEIPEESDGAGESGSQAPVKLDLKFDINRDGTLNTADVAAMQQIVLDGLFVAEYDLNSDGVINLGDYAYLCDYLKSVGIEVVEEEESEDLPGTEDLRFDVNGDGFLNIDDARYLRQLVYSDHWDERADLNFDGVVNIADYVVLCDYFNSLGIDYSEQPEEGERESETDDNFLGINFPEFKIKRPLALIMIAALAIAIVLLSKKPRRGRRR